MGVARVEKAGSVTCVVGPALLCGRGVGWVRRSAGKWEFPGGKVEAHESPHRHRMPAQLLSVAQAIAS